MPLMMYQVNMNGKKIMNKTIFKRKPINLMNVTSKLCFLVSTTLFFPDEYTIAKGSR